MTPFYHQINSRQLTAFTPLANELGYDPQKNYLFDLSYLSGIQVLGERAQEFLQGQLSCDVREINDQEMRQGALCNLKGRILALVDIINGSEHGVNLILPADLLIETQASLNKTAMLSRVSLRHSTDYQLFGFYLQNPDDEIPFQIELPSKQYGMVHHDNFCCYYLGEKSYVFLVNPKHVHNLRAPFIKTAQWRGSLAWHALQLEQKRINIYQQSRGMFLPHRLDLQLTSYLSFNKGCYKGQEIIARTHYRAKLKHTLKRFTIQTNEPLQSGQRLLSEDGTQEIGELVDYCPLGEEKYIIAASVIFEHPSSVLIEGQNSAFEMV